MNKGKKPILMKIQKKKTTRQKNIKDKKHTKIIKDKKHSKKRKKTKKIFFTLYRKRTINSHREQKLKPALEKWILTFYYYYAYNYFLYYFLYYSYTTLILLFYQVCHLAFTHLDLLKKSVVS